MADVKFAPVFGHPLNIAHLLSNPPPTLDFVLPGLTSGSVGTLIGPGGVGKTMLELQVAVLLATGLGHYDPCSTSHVRQSAHCSTKSRFGGRRGAHQRCGSACTPSCNPSTSVMCCPTDMSWPGFLQRLEQNLLLYPWRAPSGSTC